MRMRTYKRNERQSWPLFTSKVGSPSKVAKKRRLASLAGPPSCGLKVLSPIKGWLRGEESWPSPHKGKMGGLKGCVKKGGGHGGGDWGSRRDCRGEEERGKLLQMCLDFGQSDFERRKVCDVCGMMWVQGAPDDEAQHRSFCSSFLKGVPFLGWRKERVAAEWPEEGREGTRVVEIRPDDPSKHLMKLKEVLKQADTDMGFARGKEEAVKQRAFIYIARKRVVGCILAEAIHSERLLLEDTEHGSNNPEECETVTATSMVGIYQMWTHESYRRKGVATRLLNTVRQRFVWGMKLGCEALAFSQPTTDGIALAKAYCGSERISIYKIK